MTNDVTVTIKDLNISSKDQKTLQKLKAALEKTVWGAGNVHEDKGDMEFFERAILKQDLFIYYMRPTRIVINVGGSDIDRDNLALIEKILKKRATIDIVDGKLRLEFEFYPKDDTYTQFGFYKSKDEIPMTMAIKGKVWKCEINGYTWKNRDYS
jgi:hypothetical protein